MDIKQKASEVTHVKRKCGIIYISTLPKHMNVTKVREIFSHYGDVGRMFLQPAQTSQGEKKKKKRRLINHFTEGWIEFQSKRIAKKVALQLNNTRIGERKKSKFYDHLWNIKYLPRFKWVHLNERLAYERAVHQQRLRTEISQAKREVSFIAHNMERSERLSNIKEKNSQDIKCTTKDSKYLTEFKQRKTDKEIHQDNKMNKQLIKSEQSTVGCAEENRSSFLKDLFGSGT